MVATHGVGMHTRVAANPGASGALLEELAHHQPPVRRALREIAGHPNATAAALTPCLGDPRAAEAAAAHPALSPSLLASLLTGPDEAWPRRRRAIPRCRARTWSGWSPEVQPAVAVASERVSRRRARTPPIPGSRASPVVGGVRLGSRATGTTVNR